MDSPTWNTFFTRKENTFGFADNLLRFCFLGVCWSGDELKCFFSDRNFKKLYFLILVLGKNSVCTYKRFNKYYIAQQNLNIILMIRDI